MNRSKHIELNLLPGSEVEIKKVGKSFQLVQKLKSGGTHGGAIFGSRAAAAAAIASLTA